jgi:hypothetical protein
LKESKPYSKHSVCLITVHRTQMLTAVDPDISYKNKRLLSTPIRSPEQSRSNGVQ